MKASQDVNIYYDKTIKMVGFSARAFQLPPRGAAMGQDTRNSATDIFVFSGKILIVVGEEPYEGNQGRSYSLPKGICFSTLAS